ncbi:Phosphoserine phosphatase [Nymphon striatum]|nr:Phosphoserine phosphatase [Nymphon striatum]
MGLWQAASSKLSSCVPNITTMDVLDRVSEELVEIWKNADAVCFDVDSTVCKDEGIDELAKYCEVHELVSQMTRRAMSEGTDFKESFKARLNAMNLTKDKLRGYTESHKPNFTEGIQDVVKKLHSNGSLVFLISGGIESLILPVAKILNIPKERVFCNKLNFSDTGHYCGFEERDTCNSGGKQKVISRIRKEYGIKTIVMVGDGMTDLEASNQADLFIGFGGNIAREKCEEMYKVEEIDFCSSSRDITDKNMAGKLVLLILLGAICYVYCSQCPADEDIIELQRQCIANKPIYLGYEVFTGASIPAGLFNNLTIRDMDIAESELTSVSDNAFEGSERSLLSFFLHKSNLTSIPGKAFQHVESLADLGIQNSFITSVKKSEIDYLPATLAAITLKNNKISSIEPKAFSKLALLEDLILTNNLLSSIPADAFPSKLGDLYLSQNKFKMIPVDAINNLLQGSVVHLSHNLITSLPGEKDLATVMKTKIFIELENNKIICDCGTKWILKYETSDPSTALIKGPCVGGSGKRSFKYIESLTKADFDDCP